MDLVDYEKIQPKDIIESLVTPEMDSDKKQRIISRAPTTAISINKFLDVFSKNRNALKACSMAGITYQTYWRWIKKFSWFEMIIKDIREQATEELDDIAISGFKQLLLDGNITAILAQLNNSGVKKGFGWKVEKKEESSNKYKQLEGISIETIPVKKKEIVDPNTGEITN